jgi:ABC-type Zn2+ transport system substrate-binding protein/surface adhesin
MENKALSDSVAGIFRLRRDDPHMTDSVIVDVHDEAYTTLTTVEVRSGAVVLHCLASLDHLEEEDTEEDEDTDEASEESDEEDDEEEDDDEDEDEEEDEDEGSEDTPVGKTYTVASGNSVTVRAIAVRLEPLGLETAEGTYRVQMMRSAD